MLESVRPRMHALKGCEPPTFNSMEPRRPDVVPNLDQTNLKSLAGNVLAETFFKVMELSGSARMIVSAPDCDVPIRIAAQPANMLLSICMMS